MFINRPLLVKEAIEQGWLSNNHIVWKYSYRVS